VPVVDYARYCDMLRSAHAGGYAYPAINISAMASVPAALEGFASAGSDGILQVSLGTASHVSGALADPVLGAIALSDYVRRLAERFDVNVALHTDHCPTQSVETFLAPLIEETAKRRRSGLPNLFNSHMYDGSDLPLDQNMANALPLLARCHEQEIVLEVEAGVVGGEEDGLNREGTPREKLYTTPGDMLATRGALSQVEGARFMLAATFGNVHGVYKPGNVILKPEVLGAGQEAVAARYGEDARFWLVFHGGSGSSVREIHQSLNHGVVKMNVDTDTQYAFTRPVVDHVFRHYDGVLKVDGEVGVKKLYDPRAYLGAARQGMAERVAQACRDLKSAGKAIGR